MKYTEEDVERLVKASEDCCQTWQEGGGIWSDSHRHRSMHEALEPFRPDPEEELIEAMAKAMAYAEVGHDGGFGEAIVRPWREPARHAYQVVKEKGLPT